MPMSWRESEALDRWVTGNYGEDSVPPDDDTLDTLKRILSSFDLDIFAEGSHFTGLTYTARLWEDGEQVAEATGKDLATVLAQIDATAEALVSAYCS